MKELNPIRKSGASGRTGRAGRLRLPWLFGGCGAKKRCADRLVRLPPPCARESAVLREEPSQPDQPKSSDECASLRRSRFAIRLSPSRLAREGRTCRRAAPASRRLSRARECEGRGALPTGLSPLCVLDGAVTVSSGVGTACPKACSRQRGKTDRQNLASVEPRSDPRNTVA